MLARADYWKRIIAGGTFGLYMTELLYLLNPQIAVEPLRFVRDIVVYVVICGVLFGNIFWAIHRIRERFIWPSDESDRTHGFGYLVAVAFYSAVIYWAHLVLLRIYLPRGAVRILSKATLLLGALAILLLVIWMLERNATKTLSRAFFIAALALIAGYAIVTYQRREGYEEERLSRTVARVAPAPPLEQVTLVVLRDVPFDWIVQIAGEGALSVVSSTAPTSYLTRIEPFRTTSKSALWASLATGKLPSRHGVTGRYSFQTALTPKSERWLLVPSGVGFRGWGLIPPVERVAAQLPAGDGVPFWQILAASGASVNVVNWPATASSDAERLDVTSDQEIRRRSGNAALDQVLERDLRILRGTLAGPEAANANVVVLDGVAEIIRRSAIERNELPASGSRAGALVREHLRKIDAELRSVPSDRLLIVMSNGGARPPTLPGSLNSVIRMLTENDGLGAADGFFYLSGAGVQRRPNAVPLQLIDVAPTLLYVNGYPIARDFDGRIAIECFSEDYLRRRPLMIVQSYDTSIPVR